MQGVAWPHNTTAALCCAPRWTAACLVLCLLTLIPGLAQAWLLLGKLEQAVADTEEAQERLQEARLAAKGRGHTFASKHSPNDALRDIRWWHER